MVLGSKEAQWRPGLKLCIGVILGSVVLHAVPFFIYGAHPLGFDTGFYRRYLLNPYVSFPNTPVPGLDHTVIVPRVWFDILRATHLPVDVILYGSYFVLFIALAIAFYLFASEVFGKHIALIATMLFAVSPVQYLGYWYFLYKNFFALIFFFLALFFIERKRFWVALAMALFIPPSHQTTTLIFLAVLVGYAIIHLLSRRVMWRTLFLLAFTGIEYLYLHPHVSQKIAAPPVGIFLEKEEFILLTLPLLLAAVFGWRHFYTALREHPTCFSLGIVLALFPFFSLPYYQRMFLFTDFMVISAGACGLYALQNRYADSQKYIYGFIMGVCLLGYVLATGFQIYRLRPLIDSATLPELNELKAFLPDGSAVLTSARLAPWVSGWTQARVFAPGILKDRHTAHEWRMYWIHADAHFIREFLATFPRPLYIFINPADARLFLPSADCIQRLTDMLYVLRCTTVSL